MSAPQLLPYDLERQVGMLACQIKCSVASQDKLVLSALGLEFLLGQAVALANKFYYLPEIRG